MAAAVEKIGDIDSLDLTGYRCVYISFGSKNQEGTKPFFQDFPYFLEYINKYRLCTISIDDYAEFEKEEEDVPHDIWEEKPRKTPRPKYTRICIPSKTMAQTIQIATQLVELLSKYKTEQILFVNFIKYLNEEAYDARHEREAMEIVSHLGKFKDCYYDWCGFRPLIKSFILKPNTPVPIFGTVEKLIEAKFLKKDKSFFDALKDDEALSAQIHSGIYEVLRSCLIDITPTITGGQLISLNPEYPKFSDSGGKRTRKRRRRRRTRR